MVRRALIVESNPEIREEIVEVVLSLGHEFICCGNQKKALEHLSQEKNFTYVIAGLLMAVNANARLKTPDNCSHFLHQARKITTIPIIVTSPAEYATKGYGPKLMRAGAFDLIDLPAPSKGRSLGEAVRDALRRENKKDYDKDTVAPFTKGILTFYKDRIELNGIVLVESDDIGMAAEFLKILATPTPSGKRPKLGISKLVKLLKASSPQAITSMICRLRRKMIAAFMKEQNVKIVPEQVIVNKPGKAGGYYLSENITVENLSEEEMQGAPAIEKITDLQLSTRQNKIVEHICKRGGINKHHVAKICRCSPRTVLRELTPLRKLNIIEFIGHGSLGTWQLCQGQEQNFCGVGNHD